MHIIRLRHPWKCESRDGSLCWSRSFNWPSDNGPDATIFLAVRPWNGETLALLNDQLLKIDESTSRCDVTLLLREFNRLQIHLPAETCTDGHFPLNVQLEIEELEAV